MAAYTVANYRITDPESYEAYPPAVVPTLMAHGAEILVADRKSETLEGEPAHVTVVVKFPAGTSTVSVSARRSISAEVQSRGRWASRR